MRKIPPKLRQEMADDPFYKQCCITGRSDEKIEWHHNLQFAGKQVNEKWCILPLLKSIHDEITRKGYASKYKEICDWIMLNRASNEDLKKYSKLIKYVELRRRLNRKYKNYFTN